MRITVVTLTDVTFNLDVNEELELENFKAYCEVESGIPTSEILLVFNGRPLVGDKKTLKVGCYSVRSIETKLLMFNPNFGCRNMVYLTAIWLCSKFSELVSKVGE